MGKWNHIEVIIWMIYHDLVGRSIMLTYLIVCLNGITVYNRNREKKMAIIIMSQS